MSNSLNEINFTDLNTPVTDLSTDLAPQKNLPVFRNDTSGLDAGDTFVPRIRLGQALTPEVQAGTAKQGQWLVFGNDPVDTLRVIPMAVAKTRALDVKNDKDETMTLCESQDAVTGFGEPGGVCAKCPMAQWINDKPPKCDLTYSYQVWIPQMQCIGLLVFSRTTSAQARSVNTFAQMRGFGKFAIVLGAEKKTNTAKKASYYSPTISGSPVTADEISEVQLLMS